MKNLPGMKFFLVALLLALACATGEVSGLDHHADKLVSLIDAAKLGTIGTSGAKAGNPGNVVVAAAFAA